MGKSKLIKIDEILKQKLDILKLHPKDTYNNVISRILDTNALIAKMSERLKMEAPELYAEFYEGAVKILKSTR